MWVSVLLHGKNFLGTRLLVLHQNLEQVYSFRDILLSIYVGAVISELPEVSGIDDELRSERLNCMDMCIPSYPWSSKAGTTRRGINDAHGSPSPTDMTSSGMLGSMPF